MQNISIKHMYASSRVCTRLYCVSRAPQSTYSAGYKNNNTTHNKCYQINTYIHAEAPLLLAGSDGMCVMCGGFRISCALCAKHWWCPLMCVFWRFVWLLCNVAIASRVVHIAQVLLVNTTRARAMHTARRYTTRSAYNIE